MSNPVILVESFFRDSHGTVTDPSAATGFPAARLYDEKNYLAWKASSTAATFLHVDLGVAGALEANAFMLLGSNLDTGDYLFQVDYSDDNAFWVSVLALTAVQAGARDNGNIFATFDGAGAHRYWRVFWGASGGAVAEAREIYLGRRLEFDYGIDPAIGFDPRAETPQNRMYQSEKGYIVETLSDFVGRSPTWSFRRMVESFWDDETEWTGFKWWWQNYALLGRMGVFMWNPGVLGSAFENDGLFGVPLVQGSPTLDNSVDQGHRSVSFSLKARRDG